MDKTLVYARTNGEPKVVELSDVKGLLANGYVKDFMKAENLDVELLEKALHEIEKAETWGGNWIKRYPHIIKPFYDMAARFHYSFYKALQAQARAQKIKRTRKEADRIRWGLGMLRKAIAPDLEYQRYQKLKRKWRRWYGIQNVGLSQDAGSQDS